MSAPRTGPADVRLTFRAIAPGSHVYATRITPLTGDGHAGVSQVYEALLMGLAKVGRDLGMDEEAYLQSVQEDLRALLTYRDGEA